MATVKEINFRKIYHQYCYFNYDEKIEDLISRLCPNTPVKGNGILTYCYIDYQAGMTFELLGMVNYEESGILNICYECDHTSKIRSGFLIDYEVTICKSDVIEQFNSDYLKSIIPLINKDYKADKNVENTREIEELDNCRNSEYPDDVLVYFIMKGKQTEGVWLRCEGLISSGIVGMLLNEPDQDFGVHINDSIKFQVVKNDDAYVCAAVFN